MFTKSNRIIIVLIVSAFNRFGFLTLVINLLIQATMSWSLRDVAMTSATGILLAALDKIKSIVVDEVSVIRGHFFTSCLKPNNFTIDLNIVFEEVSLHQYSFFVFRINNAKMLL